MTDDVRVRTMPAQLVLARRARVTMGTIGEAMAEAFSGLTRHSQETGARPAGPPFVLYPQMPEGEFEIAVCLPVMPGAVPGAGVEVEELAETEAATLRYQGPYESMEPSWRRLVAWVSESGLLPNGPMREIYVNEPGQVSQDHLLTDLVVPVR